MKLHYLSEKSQNAKRLSPSGVAGKIKSGWVWHRLLPAFCSSGGVGSYSRALVSPEGEIAYVSDLAEGPDPQSDLPVIEFDHSLVRLEVPFDQKQEAKTLGAIWVGGLKVWACAPDQLEKFRKWVHGDPVVFDLMSPSSGGD